MMFWLLRHLLLPLFLRRLNNVDGAEHLPQTGYLIVANHIDYLDGFFISAAIARAQQRQVRFLSETNNYWWTGGSTIPLAGTTPDEALAAVRAALESGSVVCIFPEGRRNTENTLLPGKTGSARIALWSGCPVIPIGLSGPAGKSFAESVRTLLFRRRPVTLRIGTPLRFAQRAPDAITKEDLTKTTQVLMGGIGAVCAKTTYF